MAGCWSLEGELTTGPRLTGSDQSENWPKWRGRQRLCSCSSARTNLSATARVQSETAKRKPKVVVFRDMFVLLYSFGNRRGGTRALGSHWVRPHRIRFDPVTQCLLMLSSLDGSEFVSGFRFP